MLERRVVLPVAIDGEPGQNGRNGRDGRNAYEVAKDAGFRGSVQQWLDSMRGKDGTNGVDGVSLLPQSPTHALFDRDPDTHLTERLRVFFPEARVDIIPSYDDEGFMLGATFNPA